MGLQPDLKKRASRFKLKTCAKCGQTFGDEGFAPTRSMMYPDGTISICNDCIDKMIQEEDGDWEFVDKLCQYADIPFIPREWEKLRDMGWSGAFYRYASIFVNSSEYDNLGWGEYFKAFKALKDDGQLESELPLLGDAKRENLKRKWGRNYDDEALDYLERLFNGLMTTQNVNGDLQVDQALKICKISYELDRRIEEGADIDKLLASYDKLVKTAEFTPKNVKNINDFDSVGEVVKWMEKNGWVNKFYDNVTRDIVDESMKNFEGFNRRLYINESNIGPEVDRRIQALNNTAKMENYYETDKEYDLDKFDAEAYEVDFGDEGEKEEFNPEED